MLPDLIGAAVCFAIGIGIAFLNFAISKHTLKTNLDKIALTTVLRTFISVSFLGLVCLASKLLGRDITFMLIGAALGATLPTPLLTKSLLNYSNELAKNKESSEKKEDALNG